MHIESEVCECSHVGFDPSACRHGFLTPYPVATLASPTTITNSTANTIASPFRKPDWATCKVLATLCCNGLYPFMKGRDDLVQ